MQASVLFGILFSVAAGLGVFLLGMKHLSEGIQAIAGQKLRKMIGLVTNNRVVAAMIGTGVTVLVQSSSITTVMVVGFVNSGFMTLKQAVGVIFGANIGTTITGWIISTLPKVGKFGLPILGLAALFYLFSRKERSRFISMAIMGIGMIFFGLDTMSSGLKPIRSDEGFIAFFELFQATSYFGVLKCAFIGCIMTLIVQSSSATLGITMVLLGQGSIGFETAAALVLGENIGTTITAYLASLGANTNAKRAAYAHIMFNVLGVAWATAIFLPVLLPLSYAFMGEAPSEGTLLFGVALVHTCFNVTNTLVFLPFMGILTKVVTRMVPGKGDEDSTHLTFIDVQMVNSPSIAIEQSRREILVMADGVRKMFGYLRTNLEAKEWDTKLEEKTFRREDILDNIQREVTVFLGRLLQGRVSGEATEEARLQLRLADELESLSDEIVTLMKLHRKADKNQLHFSEAGKVDILKLLEEATAYLEFLYHALEHGDHDILATANAKTTTFNRMTKECRRTHLVRMSDDAASPLQSLIFTDVLKTFRLINDHLLNAAEAAAGEK
jgi:phosphate:Na+ symporter